MKIEIVPISKLKAAQYNPRKISKKDMDDLVYSIQEFGFTEPVVVNKDGTVISGHQRIEAAARLKLEEVPVFYVDLPKNRERALNLAMNKIGGYFDSYLLVVTLEEIEKEDRELGGFDEDDVERITKKILKDDSEQTERTPKEQETMVTCPDCGHRFAIEE